MALLDFFKKKGRGSWRPKSSTEKASPQKLSGEGAPPPKERAELKEKIPASLRAARTLIAPHVTEKSSVLNAKGVYTFKVQDSANKSEVKKAVQELYGVGVNAVNIINIPSKRRFSRGRSGTKKGYKKALVILAKGERIELM